MKRLINVLNISADKRPCTREGEGWVHIYSGATIAAHSTSSALSSHSGHGLCPVTLACHFSGLDLRNPCKWHVCPRFHKVGVVQQSRIRIRSRADFCL